MKSGHLIFNLPRKYLFTKSVSVAQRQSRCLARRGPRVDPDRLGVLNKIILIGTKRYGAKEPQLLVSVSSIPGLNPQSLRSTNDVKTCILLIAIRRLGEDVKPCGPSTLSKRIG